MTADPLIAAAQRRVLDLAGHRDVTVAESVAESVQWHTITDPDTRPDDPDCRPRPSLWTRIAAWFK